MKSRLRSFLVSTALTVVAAFFAVIVFEVYDDYRFDLRIYSVDATGTQPYAEPQFFSTVRPMETRVYTTAFRDAKKIVILAQYDQHGMRSRRPVSEFPHDLSVALIGDSFTWGAEVDYPDTLQGQLEQRFEGVNILNFGLSGSNSMLFARTTERFQARVGKRLDAAIVGIYTDLAIGDLPRMAAVDRYGERVIFDGVAVSRNAFDRLVTSAWDRLLFQVHIEARRYSSTYNRLFPPRASQEFAIPLVDERDDRRMSEWSNRLLLNMSKFATAAHLDPSRIIIWLVPSNHELYATWSAAQARAPVPEPVQWSDRFWRGVAARMSEAGYRVIDPREAVQDLFLRDGLYPYSASGHFRPEAYRVVADQIEPQLRKLLGEPRR